jgi:hypothetical protein
MAQKMFSMRAPIYMTRFGGSCTPVSFGILAKGRCFFGPSAQGLRSRRSLNLLQRNKFVGVSTPGGVPGPTSKLSLRVPAQMGRRETEHKGGKQ